MGIHVLRRLKEIQTQATDEQLGVIINVMLFKTIIPIRNYIKFKTIMDALLCGP